MIKRGRFGRGEYRPPRVTAIPRIYTPQHQTLWWAALMELQEGCCDCCHVELEEDNPGYVDHHHETGSVRGVICARCNVIIGRLECGRELIPSRRVELAETYLERHLPRIRTRMQTWLARTDTQTILRSDT